MCVCVLMLALHVENASAQSTTTCEGDQTAPADLEDHDYFGSSAISGDFAVIGSRNSDVGLLSDVGAAYIYELDVDWTQRQKITPNNPQANEHFGESTGIDGRYLIAGSPDYDGAGIGSGRAQVFRHDSTLPQGQQWVHDDTLLATDGDNGDSFGGPVNASHQGVAISGTIAVVGAPGADLNGTVFNAGKAYVFERDSSTGEWDQSAVLEASDAAEADGFGWAVAISGKQIIVGAPFDDVSSVFDAGSAYVFRASNGAWTQTAKLTAATTVSGDNFGFSVSIDGDDAIVGSDVSTISGQFATIFERDASGWSEVQEISPSDNGGVFGRAVSISGSLAVVGARSASSHSINSTGAAYVFQREVTGTTPWTEKLKLIPEAAEADGGDRFGQSVALDGDNSVIGAIGDDPDGGPIGSQQGAAFFFVRLPSCQ